MMRVIIEDNEESVGKIAAWYVMKKIIEYQPNSQRYFVMGLPTGSTPLIMYKYLIEFYKSGQLSFKYVKTFNMDEYVVVLITGAHKGLAVMKAIESGVSHMWTVSALQMHPNSLFIIDEDATLELKIKTVKYFKGLSDDLSKSIRESPYLKR